MDKKVKHSDKFDKKSYMKVRKTKIQETSQKCENDQIFKASQIFFTNKIA
jgi:hypothetical protein